ncbi:MAG TPA: hypothetical protein VGD11_00065 [Mycobacteriales bacterium]|jgi:hypothetical protein
MSLRSGRLVSWVRAWRAGLVPFDDVVAAISAGDDEHEVADLPGHVHTVPLRTALAELSGVDPDAVRLVVPAAGDPRGLPGPGAFSTAALVSGEGAVCGRTGLVPTVARRVSGSGDVWHTVLWHAHPLPGTPVRAEPISVAEAEQELLDALRTSTDALRDLDVARWRPELGQALADLRRNGARTDLPPGYDDRAHRLLHRAELVTRIVALAGEDAPGAAVNAYEAAGRDAALRPLATAARRARTAAHNAPLRLG